jgi:hypothetical protein
MSDSASLRQLSFSFRLARLPGTMPRGAANRLQKDPFRVQSIFRPGLSGPGAAGQMATSRGLRFAYLSS